jgi:hypothetical protein
VLGDSGLKDGIVGTQFDDQIGADENLETFRHAPAKSMGLIFWIPFQSQEAEEGTHEDKKSPYLIYLFCSCRTQRQFVFEIIFHPNFVIKDKLNACIRQMPRPPSCFGRQIEPQDFRERFLDLSFGKPHQKFLNILSIEELKDIGIRKELIA